MFRDAGAGKYLVLVPAVLSLSLLLEGQVESWGLSMPPCPAGWHLVAMGSVYDVDPGPCTLGDRLYPEPQQDSWVGGHHPGLWTWGQQRAGPLVGVGWGTAVGGACQSSCKHKWLSGSGAPCAQQKEGHLLLKWLR